MLRGFIDNYDFIFTVPHALAGKQNKRTKKNPTLLDTIDICEFAVWFFIMFWGQNTSVRKQSYLIMENNVWDTEIFFLKKQYIL